MNGIQIIEAFVANDNNPLLVQCNDELNEEVGLESGCKAHVISFTDSGDNCYCLTLDFTEFEEDNKKFMPKEWYGDYSSDEKFYWYDTKYYPKNRQIDLYVDKDDKWDSGLDLFEKSELYIEWENSETNFTYIKYLELMVDILKTRVLKS